MRAKSFVTDDASGSRVAALLLLARVYVNRGGLSADRRRELQIATVEAAILRIVEADAALSNRFAI
jgi:hypothetical protein